MNTAEEKARDLANQRKNTNGNSYEAARNGIRRFKRASARKERRGEKASPGSDLDGDHPGGVLPIPLLRQKSPDTPMGEILTRRLADPLERAAVAGNRLS